MRQLRERHIRILFWQNLEFVNISFTTGFQKWIGYGDVKSLPVYFYVQRSTGFNTTNTSITFDTARLNDGGAMNLSSGIVTAPRTGTYFFSFSAIATFPTSSSVTQAVRVGLFFNGNLIAWVWRSWRRKYYEWSKWSADPSFHTLFTSGRQSLCYDWQNNYRELHCWRRNTSLYSF